MVKTAMIVGYGSHGRGAWLKAIRQHPDWKLIGIIDTDTELLENVGELGIGLDADQGYISIDDAVRFGEEKPDLCCVATPIYTHHVLVKEIMDHGINVICEKNMASTIYQGRQMVQLAHDHPELCTAVGTNYRYWTKYWTAHKFFHEPGANLIGDLAYIKWESGGNWGEKRTGWRRWLQEVYAEDMAPHWFDLLRFITGLDVVHVRADNFIPNYSVWQGSSTIFASLALAAPENYTDRHKWVWVQLYGDWQRRGPGYDNMEFFGGKGQGKLSPWGVECKIYLDEEGRKWEEDGYLPQNDIGGLDKPYQGQTYLLEDMKRCIDSNGERQPGTNFKEAFKSFAVSMGAIESSRTGQAIWVPDYWKGLPL